MKICENDSTSINSTHTTNDDSVDNWYVIHTISGREHNLIQFIESNIDSNLVKECFVPKRERSKKFNGKRQTITERLFPGYVFVITPKPEQLFFELKQYPNFSKILCDSEYTFASLNEKEIDFIRRIGNGRPDHTIKISTVDFNIGDNVVYIEGDLKSFEGEIKKFDKHKRQAVVETEMFGRTVEVYLGFDFLQKIPS